MVARSTCLVALAVWSSGMILGLGPRGPGFNSQNSPSFNVTSRRVHVLDGEIPQVWNLTGQQKYQQTRLSI